MRHFIITTVLLICMNSLTLVQAQTTSVNYTKDVTTEAAIVSALYEVISGEPGEPRDWERFKYLFAKDAFLIPTNKSTEGVFGYRKMTPEDYINFFSTRIKTGFFEKELKHELVSFGTVTHVFSTYETRETKNGPITNRGINSIQLFNDQNRYYIMNVFWCAESLGFTLPPASLK